MTTLFLIFREKLEPVLPMDFYTLIQAPFSKCANAFEINSWYSNTALVMAELDLYGLISIYRNHLAASVYAITYISLYADYLC